VNIYSIFVVLRGVVGGWRNQSGESESRAPDGYSTSETD
jgi:hypothetical protein